MYFLGMGPVHMNEVKCSGFEKSVTECPFNMDKDSEGCSHEEDAGVRCNVPAMGFQQRVRTYSNWLTTEMHFYCHSITWPVCSSLLQLRLSGGHNPFEGRVEVLVERNGSLVWGTVCSEGWGTMEAMVVCRQLGLGFASNAFQVCLLSNPHQTWTFESHIVILLHCWYLNRQLVRYVYPSHRIIPWSS